MHLIIYGAEGSGKGTQAEMLGKKLSLPLFTSGDLVRDAASNDKGELGTVCRTALSTGIYVSDDHMISLWKKRLESQQAIHGFILDGFPRNRQQAEFLIGFISKLGYSIDKVIHLHISDEESIKRLVLRNRKLFAGSNETHDSPDLVKKRLKHYRSAETALLEYFAQFNLVVTVNAQQSRNEVFADILKALLISE